MQQGKKNSKLQSIEQKDQIFFGGRLLWGIHAEPEAQTTNSN